MCMIREVIRPNKRVLRDARLYKCGEMLSYVEPETKKMTCVMLLLMSLLCLKKSRAHWMFGIRLATNQMRWKLFHIST